MPGLAILTPVTRQGTKAQATLTIAALAAALLLYLGVTHGLSGAPLAGHDGMSQAAALCLVLVVLLAPLVVRGSAEVPGARFVAIQLDPASVGPSVAAAPTARASPALLQRFLL